MELNSLQYDVRWSNAFYNPWTSKGMKAQINGIFVRWDILQIKIGVKIEHELDVSRM